MNIKKLFAALAVFSAGTVFATSTPEGWTDDFEAAKAQAKSEGKLLLVDFSGSDWCGWCKRLDKEVFSMPEFLEGVKNDFVLVMIDSPSDKSLLSEKAKEQNPKVKKTYDKFVSGYPTVLIMDADGEVVEKTGYRDGGPEPYVKFLRGAKKAAAAFKALDAEIAGMKPGDPARLSKIDAAICKLDESVLENHEKYVTELIENDKDGKYAAKYPKFAFVKPLENKLRNVFVELNDEMRKRITAAAKEAGVKPRKLDGEKTAEIRKALDAIAIERLSALKSDAEAVKAKAPASAQKHLDGFIGQLDRIIGRVKGDE